MIAGVATQRECDTYLDLDEVMDWHEILDIRADHQHDLDKAR